ncbi:MAG: amidotransferase 1, exosortase A system-associated [Gammaproteobacteria bacterium]|nr:amidotransferase 1, exosortase A system-associated [Gammaproteobacteria bacterium]
MCGVVGIFDLNHPSEINREILTAMNQVQYHRGPDEGDIYTDPGVGLGHRRLSIIDLGSGQQPMTTPDGRATIVYNGEVYNFQELREQLTSKGYTFSTHCDTEVILNAWMEWGEQCVDHLRGMFAFAVWDRKHQSLFIARDRLGIKPLYYAILPNQHLIFGSELKALMVHPDFRRNIDPSAIEDYFAFGYVPDPKTIFRNVYKLAPGYRAIIKRGDTEIRPQQYWDLPFTPNNLTDERQIQEELVERLKEAVRIRMVADVPLGAFLSGGVDSGAVVALMAEMSDSPVNTCSIGFDHQDFDETDYAQLVAERFHTNHFTKTVASDDFDMLDQLVALYDEPYADSSALPTYRVCQLARERVTVALSGDGGDENLAGYRRYRWFAAEENMRNLMPTSIRKPLFGLLAQLYPKADWAPRPLRAKATFQALARNSLEGYFHSVSFLNDDMRKQLFSDQLKSELQGYQAIEVFNAIAKNAPTDDALSTVLYTDFKTYLPGDILTKVDRASMAHSLEVRVPILDHQFVEWVSGLNPNLKLRHAEGKYIFKKSLQSRLPHDILYRPKMGFGVPLAAWFRGPLKERIHNMALSGPMMDSSYFNSSHVKTMIDQHISGKRDHSTPIWTLLMFDSFLRNAMQ